MSDALAAQSIAFWDALARSAGWTLLLLVVRLLPFVLLLPLFGGVKASPLVRSAALLALVVGFWPAELQAPIHASAALLTLSSQLAFSLVTSTCALALFEAARMVGGIADSALGRGSFGAADPLGGATGPLSTFHAMLFTAVFAATGSHVVLLRTIAGGLANFPLNTVLSGEHWAALVDLLIQASSAAIAAAIALALPALAVGLIVDVSLGWMNRALPKLQVVFLAMPIRMVFGWIVVAGTLAIGIPYLVDATLDALASANGSPGAAP